MQITTTQKRAIDHYYKELAAYHTHKVTHETAVRSAFQNLLATYAQSANWILIPEQAFLRISIQWRRMNHHPWRGLPNPYFYYERPRI